jgi:NAD(P)-dependent dehydrogenase (short-subunit alcohol dehydrogenase family)
MGTTVSGDRRLGPRPRKGVAFLDLDVAGDESVAAVVEQVIDRFGRIDVLVNNARYRLDGRRRGGLRRAGAARLRHQRLRCHPHDERRPATMRRMVPSRMFDQQLRKLNRLPA